MASSALLSLEEHLNTRYRPDRDYNDGEARERNVGLMPHARMMTLVSAALSRFQEATDTVALLSIRIRVSEARVLVADACLAWRKPWESVLQTPPLLCVEILQPEDTFIEIAERVDNYVAMGVRCVWVIDPFCNRAYIVSASSFVMPADGVLTVPATPIRIVLTELFAQVDAFEGGR